MIPFTDLTRLGRLRCMRKLASAALLRFGVNEGRFHLLRQAGNTLFKVRTDRLPASLADGDLFEPGQYLLRLHEPGYQEPQAIELELTWLSAMRKAAGLPVQEPVTAPDGRYLLELEVPEVPGGRFCSLLRWVRGHSVKNRFCPHHRGAQDPGNLLSA